MKRVCPFCKSDMHANSVYFCVSCGNVLPEGLQLKNLSFKKSEKINLSKSTSTGKKSKVAFRKKSGIVDLKFVSMGILFVVLVGVGFYSLVKLSDLNISKIANNTQDNNSNISDPSDFMPKENLSTQVELPAEKGVAKMDIKTKSGPFGQKDIYEFIPYDADFYAEFNDPETLEPYFSFMGGDFFTLTENLKGKVENSYSVFFMEKEAKRGWVFVVFPLEEGLSLGVYKDLVIREVEGALIISLQSRLVDEVGTSKAGITKSLSLNPVFITLKPNIPAEGKGLLVSLTENGSRVAGDLMESTSSAELKLIVEAFNKAGSRYLVIQ